MIKGASYNHRAISILLNIPLINQLIGRQKQNGKTLK